MSRTGNRDYRARRAKLLATADTCWLCGQWIDPALTYPDPMSGSADHVTAVADGGHNLGLLMPAHVVCNKARGNKPADAVRYNPTSERW